jgi:hypothetical protein
MMSAGGVLKPEKTFWKAWIGGIKRRTPGKIKYQTHRNTYRKRENLVQTSIGEQQVYLVPDK